MADPRDELAYADMLNEPGLLPPREPLRIRVSPYDTPPPSETGWGGFGAGGRPAGRLFEPDLEPAPAPTGPGPAEEPQPPWQGGRLLDPGQSPAPPKPQWQPGLFSLVNIPRVIGGLVQGAKDSLSQPATASSASSAAVASPAARDPTAGSRAMWQQGYPSAPYSSMLKGPAEAAGHVATEVLQEPYNLVRAGQGIASPGATDQQVQQAREQEAAAATNLTSNLLGMNAPFSAARPGASAGVFGGRLAKGLSAEPRPQAPAGAKFPQYAERYPETGPPVQAVDPKTGKEYLAKQQTPEAEAFAKELRKIDKAMAKEGYTPYFDPSKREHVDPTHYPPNVDTRTIIPKKLTEKDEVLIPIVTGEESRARLRAAYQRGTEMPNTKDWYAMKQLEDEFIKELGPEAGRKAFQEKIATSMGATTGGADPTTNWRMAQYGNYLRQNNLPYPAAAHEMPYPIGGRFAGQNIALHKKIFDAGGFPALGKEYPKRHNFSQNFTGNRGAATMDEQMSDLMTPGTLMPPKGRYGYYENTLGEEAAKVGVQPQNYQDVAWSGAKNLKDPRYASGEPFIQTINESIERTHRLTGMPREEIVRRGIIRSEIPMYGMAGPNPIGSLVDPQGYNR